MPSVSLGAFDLVGNEVGQLNAASLNTHDAQAGHTIVVLDHFPGHTCKRALDGARVHHQLALGRCHSLQFLGSTAGGRYGLGRTAVNEPARHGFRPLQGRYRLVASQLPTTHRVPLTDQR